MKTKGRKSKALVTGEMLDAAVDTVLVGVDNLVDSLKKEFKKDLSSLRKNLKDEIDPIKTDIVFIKRDISDIKADLSITPSKREFDKLRSKVDSYHPLGVDL